MFPGWRLKTIHNYNHSILEDVTIIIIFFHAILEKHPSYLGKLEGFACLLFQDIIPATQHLGWIQKISEEFGAKDKKKKRLKGFYIAHYCWSLLKYWLKMYETRKNKKVRNSLMAEQFWTCSKQVYKFGEWVHNACKGGTQKSRGQRLYSPFKRLRCQVMSMQIDSNSFTLFKSIHPHAKKSTARFMVATICRWLSSGMKGQWKGQSHQWLKMKEGSTLSKRPEIQVVSGAFVLHPVLPHQDTQPWVA